MGLNFVNLYGRNTIGFTAQEKRLMVDLMCLGNRTSGGRSQRSNGLMGIATQQTP
jgi:hypothetical protein